MILFRPVLRKKFCSGPTWQFCISLLWKTNFRASPCWIILVIQDKEGFIGYMEEKRRVLSHWYKTHLYYTKSPYYCTICLFKATKEKDLIDHIKRGVYPPHQRGVDLKHQMNLPVELNNILIKNHTAKYPVESVDFICMTKEESVSIWGQRMRLLSIGSQSVPQESSTDNILSTLLDNDPYERITPVPATSPVLHVNILHNSPWDPFRGSGI